MRASAPPLETTSSPSKKINWMYFFVLTVLFAVAMMVVSFPTGLFTVFGARLSDNFSASSSVDAITANFSFTTFEIPVYSTLGGLFLGCLVIYAIFLVLAWRQGTGIFGAVKDALRSGEYLALFSNPLAATTVLLGATSLMTILVDTVQSNAGIPTGNLTGDPFSLLVDFTVAPLLEETTFRLFMLGLPIFVLSLIMFRGFSLRKALTTLWRPSAAWDADETSESEITTRSFDADPSIFPAHAAGSLKTRAIRPVVYVFLVLSSISFGYAHFSSGAGWGPGKISEAALAGLALGYLYIRFGFHTSVLLHWSIDYVGSIYSFFGQAVYGVPWTSNTGSLLDIVPTVEIVLLLGIPSFLIVLNELMKGFFRTRRQPTHP